MGRILVRNEQIDRNENHNRSSKYEYCTHQKRNQVAENVSVENEHCFLTFILIQRYRVFPRALNTIFQLVVIKVFRNSLLCSNELDALPPSSLHIINLC